MNLIFQYMIVDERCDQRGPIPEVKDRKRSEVYKQCADESAHSFGLYARKIGVDHIYSTEGEYINRFESLSSTILLFEVLRIIYDRDFDKYDKILFADTDIICNTEENIFDLCNEKDVYGVLESDIGNGKVKHGIYNTWDRSEKSYNDIVSMYERNDVPICPAIPNENSVYPSKVFMMNTGVMVWSRDARLRAREVFDDWYSWYKDGVKNNAPFWCMNDQPFISGQLMKHGFSIGNLPQTWNDSPPHYDSWDDWKDQNFLHYTGGFGKKQLIDDVWFGAFKYL